MPSLLRPITRPLVAGRLHGAEALHHRAQAVAAEAFGQGAAQQQLEPDQLPGAVGREPRRAVLRRTPCQTPRGSEAGTKQGRPWKTYIGDEAMDGETKDGGRVDWILGSELGT